VGLHLAGDIGVFLLSTVQSLFQQVPSDIDKPRATIADPHPSEPTLALVPGNERKDAAPVEPKSDSEQVASDGADGEDNSPKASAWSWCKDAASFAVLVAVDWSVRCLRFVGSAFEVALLASVQSDALAELWSPADSRGAVAVLLLSRKHTVRDVSHRVLWRVHLQRSDSNCFCSDLSHVGRIALGRLCPVLVLLSKLSIR